MPWAFLIWRPPSEAGLPDTKWNSISVESLVYKRNGGRWCVLLTYEGAQNYPSAKIPKIGLIYVWTGPTNETGNITWAGDFVNFNERLALRAQHYSLRRHSKFERYKTSGNYKYKEWDLANPCSCWWTWWAPMRGPEHNFQILFITCPNFIYSSCTEHIFCIRIDWCPTSTPPRTVRGPEPNTAYLRTL